VAFAFVRGSGTSATTSAATLALAYAAAVAAGNLLVAAAGWQSTTLGASVADSVNGAWTSIPGAFASNGVAGYSSELFYRPNTGAGTPTVTLTVGGPVAFRLLDILEYSGGATGTPLDGSQGTTTTSLTPTMSITTTHPNDLIVAHLLAAGTGGPGTGFTQRVATAANETEDKLDSGVAGASSVTAADNPATGDNFVAAAFSQTNVGVVPTRLPRRSNVAVQSAATWMKRSRRGILVPDLWKPRPVGA
jgi:hypothetical protein